MATETKERAPRVNNKSGVVLDPDEQWYRRRLPRHLPKRNNDIYVNSNTNFKGQKIRGVNLLRESGWVVVHGLGSSVPHAINLALALQVEAHAPTTVDTNTSTVYLSDDIEPTYSRADCEYAMGHAAVHIKVSLNDSLVKEANAQETS